MSRLISSFLIGMIALSCICSLAVISDNAEAGQWRTAQTMTNGMDAESRWIVAHGMNSQALTSPSKWQLVQSMVSPTNTLSTNWTVAQSMVNQVTNVHTWVMAHSMIASYDDMTEWHVAQSMTNTICNEYQTVMAQSMVNAIKPSAFVGITPHYVATGPGVISTMIYLVILWLPALLLNHLAPGYGGVIGMLLMGIVLWMSNPSFIIVLFFVGIGMIVMMLKGRD